MPQWCKETKTPTPTINDVVFFRFLFALPFLCNVCVSLGFVFTNKNFGAGLRRGKSSRLAKSEIQLRLYAQVSVLCMCVCLAVFMYMCRRNLRRGHRRRPQNAKVKVILAIVLELGNSNQRVVVVAYMHSHTHRNTHMLVHTYTPHTHLQMRSSGSSYNCYKCVRHCFYCVSLLRVFIRFILVFPRHYCPF